MNLLQQIEQDYLEKTIGDKTIPTFGAGDTVRVNFRIVEGTNERLQAFEGVCIARRNRGLQSSFTIRKLSHGEGVERVFPLYSPRVDSIEVVRRGAVRRAKLYYLRGRTGKSARIVEKRDMKEIAQRAEEKTERKKAANAERQAASAQKKAASAERKAASTAKKAAKAEKKAAKA